MFLSRWIHVRIKWKLSRLGSCSNSQQEEYLLLYLLFQRLMSVLPLMVAVITTASTLKEVLSVPVEMVLYWERTACLVKT